MMLNRCIFRMLYSSHSCVLKLVSFVIGFRDIGAF